MNECKHEFELTDTWEQKNFRFIVTETRQVNVFTCTHCQETKEEYE